MQPLRKSPSLSLLAALAVSLPLCGAALAEETIEEIAFDGETLAIVQTDDGEQSIRLGERELGKNFFAGFDRIAEVEGLPVALFYLGDGGNACGPSTLIVWRDNEGLIRELDHEDNCATPAPAISDNGIVFVPYLAPAEEAVVRSWTPSQGMETIGILQYTPEPGTGWQDIVETEIFHPIDLFRNEALYLEAGRLIGDEDFTDYARGLAVASEPRKENGLLYASGCQPHNCGGADSLIIVDQSGGKLYLAQQRDGAIRQWPDSAQWPAEAASIYGEFSASRQ